MKRNLVGKILGKIKIFVQDFVPIRTALRGVKVFRGVFCVRTPQEVRSVDIIAAVVRVVGDQGACTWRNPHLPR